MLATAPKDGIGDVETERLRGLAGLDIGDRTPTEIARLIVRS
ncbi:MAG: hypothetical protein AB7L13_11650 [Acidimicrobiia bacterium]